VKLSSFYQKIVQQLKQRGERGNKTGNPYTPRKNTSLVATKEKSHSPGSTCDAEALLSLQA
jgi:hypothetical protein